MSTSATKVIAGNLLEMVTNGSKKTAEGLLNYCIEAYGYKETAQILKEFTQEFVSYSNDSDNRAWAVVNSAPPAYPDNYFLWCLAPYTLQFTCGGSTVLSVSEKHSRKLFLELYKTNNYRYFSDATLFCNPASPSIIPRNLAV